MGTTTIRRAVCLVVAMGCALLLGGCGGTTTPAATAPSTSTPALPPTPAPSATASGPMTGDELVWLEAINGLLMALHAARPRRRCARSRTGCAAVPGS